jgi:PBP1b-binding outer membrane lipoprotein LpoB
MKPVTSSAVVIILAALSISSCSSAPEAKRDPYNDADSQRTRAQQAQDELSSETSKK